MQVKDLHNLEEQDLLNIIKKQQEEIELLKERIENLENRIKQIESHSFEDKVHDFTKDKSLENTANNTNEEESQTENKNNMQLMVIPKTSGLAILKPKFLKKVIDKRKLRLAIVYTFSFLIVAFSLFQIGRINFQKNAAIKLTDNLQHYIYISNNSEDSNGLNDAYSVDFAGLKEINPNTVGWIKLRGIYISFPVVKTDNNNFYLKHSFDDSYNVCGWIFADYRNKIDGTDKNTIIYGHNRRDGTMFSPLTEVLNPNWYDKEKNRIVTFITENEVQQFEVFSIYQTNVEDYYIQTDFKSNTDYLDFLNNLKNRSTKDFNIQLTEDDQILTLSTCGKGNKQRVVLHAKKISNNI